MAKKKKVQKPPSAHGAPRSAQRVRRSSRIARRSGESLPLAGDSVPGYNLIRKRERKTDRLLAKVRALALKQQRAEPQVFVSLRQAVTRFGAKRSAMAEVYRQLTEERILATIRGSRTMLMGAGPLARSR